MKAKSIAAVLSLVVLSLPLHAQSVASKTIPVTKQSVASNKISLNQADAATLTGSIKGIGKKRAEAIVAYRDSHHGFKSVEELAEVKGIGQKFVERNREKIQELFVVN